MMEQLAERRMWRMRVMLRKRRDTRRRTKRMRMMTRR